MPSTFLGLNTGLSGLTYFQTALNTTAHNISNADTKGYSRQNVQASASDALRLNKTYGMMGTGITASAVERQRNAYYDTKYWSANSKYSQYNSQHANLEQLQTYMNEMTSEAGYTKWMAEMAIRSRPGLMQKNVHNSKAHLWISVIEFDMLRKQ